MGHIVICWLGCRLASRWNAFLEVAARCVSPALRSLEHSSAGFKGKTRGNHPFWRFPRFKNKKQHPQGVYLGSSKSILNPHAMVPFVSYTVSKITILNRPDVPGPCLREKRNFKSHLEAHLIMRICCRTPPEKSLRGGALTWKTKAGVGDKHFSKA